MNQNLFLTLFTFWSAIAMGQTHYSKFKSPSYKTANIEYAITHDDSLKLYTVGLNKIHGLQGVEIHFREVGVDSSKLLVYRQKKLIQAIPLPFMFWHIENECLIADFDNNKKQDLKFTIWGGGSGLAGQLSYKIYLFNQGNKFTLVSFFDFSGEKEFDTNRDGIFEIIGCHHVRKGGHSYWVYNAYNFSGGKLVNISGSINYPLWTKHLFTSRNVIAKNISFKDRNKEFKAAPGELIIRK